MHHVLAAIFGGDSEISRLEKAAWHLQRYNSLMGIKLAVDRGWPKAKSSDVVDRGWPKAKSSDVPGVGA